nr:MAG TPA: hypothetical protein [Caudoviricetes sp.]
MWSNRFATSIQFSYELHVLSYMDRLYLHPILLYIGAWHFEYACTLRNSR